MSNTSLADFKVFTEAEDVVTKALYVLLSFVNIFGNSLILFVIYKNKRIQNTVNLLIANISFSDLVAGIGIYPYLFVDITREDHKAGRADHLCGFKSGAPLFFGASAVNFLTLSALSVSRFLLVNFPANPTWRMRKGHVKWVSILTWLLGMSLVLPNIASFQYLPKTETCKRFWPIWFNRSVFFGVTAIICVVAILLLFLTYTSSVYMLWFRASARRLEQNCSSTTSNASRRKVALFLGLLIMAFVACWLPFFVYWMLSAATHYFKSTLEDHVRKLRIMRFTLLVAFMNTCLDPIIYAVGNRQIKDGARRVLGGRYSRSVQPITTALE